VLLGHEDVPVSVTLGSGNDTLTVTDDTHCTIGQLAGATGEGPAQFDPLVTANGGSGSDTVRGGRAGDLLDGGSSGDTVRGEGGNDILRGGSGNDDLRGGPGDDELDGGAGSDFLAGLDGVDVVTYVSRTEAFSIRQDGQASDGAPGEADEVDSSVEKLFGGSGGDFIAGGAANNVIEGLDGDDDVRGGLGDDSVRGGNGNDEVAGGPGASTDILSGGAGDDFLQDRDAVQDFFLCRPGNRDIAFVDLLDVVSNDCEGVDRQAVDDGLPSRAVRQLGLGGDGSATVELSCPRAARVACRGALTLRRASGQPILARARYDVALAGSATVQVRLAGPAARALRARGQVVVETLEQGISEKGPRSSRRVLPVRPS
jgi:Ca2+-binding RTX toxin-like protein